MDLQKMLGEHWDKLQIVSLFEKIAQLWKSL